MPSTSGQSAPIRLFSGLPAIMLCMVAIALPLFHLHMINRIMPASHSDLVDEWVPVRDALQGKDPYSAEVTRDIQMIYYGRPVTPADGVPDQAFPYPAFLVIQLAPLASLSWPMVRLVYLGAIIPIFGLSLVLCIRLTNYAISVERTAIITVLALGSWPVMWALRLQQPTLTVASLVFGACFLLSRERGAAAGFLLAFATIKPQLVIPLLAWLLLWAVLRRMWSFIASFGATMVILLVLTEKLVPAWLPHWIAALHRYGNSHGTFPLQIIFGHWVGLIATGLLVAYTAGILWRMRHGPADSPQFAFAVALCLSVTLCFTLTILPGIYNQILLIPACLILVHARPVSYYAVLARFVAVATVGWGYVAIALAVLGENLFGPSAVWEGIPFQNLLLPVWVSVALVLSASALERIEYPESTTVGAGFAIPA